MGRPSRAKTLRPPVTDASSTASVDGSQGDVLLPRAIQEELIATLKACRETLTLAQRIVMGVTNLAIHPELLKSRTAVIQDATEAIERTKTIDGELNALCLMVEHLETVGPVH